LEDALAAELVGLGFGDVQVVGGGVFFGAKQRTACRALLWLRSAVRVLEPVARGNVESFDELYDLAASVPWEHLIGPDCTFAVRASVSHAPFSDRNFAVLRVKDAVVDRIRARCGRRPNVERTDADVPLRLVVRGMEASLFRDLAGGSLHRRGNREIQVKSPLSESVAAGLLLLTNWDQRSPLLDPMCGSGTFLVEAAAMATDRAPGIGRRFAAERFPDAVPGVWRDLREEARDRVRRSLPFPIFGSDRHAGAIGIARKVVRDAGMTRLVRFEVLDAADSEPPFAPSIVVCNPPWGGRLDDRSPERAWHALGTFLRRCQGADAWVLSGDAKLTRHLGLRASGRWPIKIGRFDARWLRYEIRARSGVSPEHPDR
jgi:putative N6-adenine-specific DNA methylase